MDRISAGQNRRTRSRVGSAFKSFQLTMYLMEVHPLLNWMHESGMPFLAKMHTQNQWTRSAKATKFFSRFKPEHAKARKRKDGSEEPLKIHLKVMRQRDWPLIETYIRLAFPDRKIGTVRRRKLPYPMAMKVSAIARG